MDTENKALCLPQDDHSIVEAAVRNLIDILSNGRTQAAPNQGARERYDEMGKSVIYLLLSIVNIYNYQLRTCPIKAE